MKAQQSGKRAADSRPNREERAALAAEFPASPLAKKVEIIEKFFTIYAPEVGNWIWADFIDDGSVEGSLDLLEIEGLERQTFEIAIQCLTFCLELYDESDRTFFLVMRRRLPNIYRNIWTLIQSLEVSSEGVLALDVRLCTGRTVAVARQLFFNDRGPLVEDVLIAHFGDIVAYCLLVPYGTSFYVLPQGTNNLALRAISWALTEWNASTAAQALGHPCLAGSSALLLQVPNQMVVDRCVQIIQTMDALDSSSFSRLVMQCCATTLSQRMTLSKSNFFEALYSKCWEWCTMAQRDQESAETNWLAQYCICHLIDTTMSKIFEESPEQWQEPAARLSSNIDTMHLLAKTLVCFTAQGRNGRLDAMPFDLVLERCSHIARGVYGVWGFQPKSSAPFDTSTIRPQLEPIWLATLQILQDTPETNSKERDSIEVWRELGTVMGFDDAGLLKSTMENNTRLQNGQAGCASYKCPLYGVETVDRMFVCVGCKRIFYCSPFCQEMDWDLHGPSCSESR